LESPWKRESLDQLCLGKTGDAGENIQSKRKDRVERGLKIRKVLQRKRGNQCTFLKPGR